MLNLFKSGNSLLEKKMAEIELKNADLENKLLQSTVELEQIKASLRETQVSLNLILNSYQGMAEEIATLYEAVRSILAPKSNKFEFSFRNSDDDDGENWN